MDSIQLSRSPLHEHRKYLDIKIKVAGIVAGG
jgi:hypothetical protein